MDTLKKLHKNYLDMLIRKAGIGVGEDTESYLVVKSLKDGYLRFYLDIEYFDSDTVLQNFQETQKYIGYKLKLLAFFSSFDDSFHYCGLDSRAFTSIPKNFKNRIGRNYSIQKNNWYILPNVEVYSNGNIDILYEIDKNGIRKYQPACS